jgi:chromosome segregation protein
MERSRLSLTRIGNQQLELEAQLREAREDEDREKGQLSAFTQEVSDLKVQAAASLERRESARRNLELLTRNHDELLRRIEQLKSEVSSSNLRAIEGNQRIQENRQEISSLLNQREALLAEVSSRRDAYELELSEVRKDEMQLKEVRQNQQRAAQEIGDTTTGLREIELELSHLATDVRRDYKVEIVSKLSAYHLLPPPTEEQLQSAEKLRIALERMGDVNPHAVEAYEELVQRYEFLSTQSKDLSESLEKLQKVIQKINRTSRKRFREAFEAINQKFTEVFPRLFSGGKAYLILEESQDVLEAGVDIVVQPPGKKLQNIELLSGGEKALTAIALLFSIFLVKPTPFCLLDEVDAPLDDVNLDRFNNMVKGMAKSSQFIIITHSKRTMETIDRLYGITMEEPGVSRVVSVQLKDDEEQFLQAV